MKNHGAILKWRGFLLMIINISWEIKIKMYDTTVYPKVGEANSRDIPHLSYLNVVCIGSCDGDGADKLQHSPIFRM